MKSEVILFIASLIMFILTTTIALTWVHETAHIEDMNTFNVSIAQVCLLGWNGRSIAWVQPMTKWGE